MGTSNLARWATEGATIWVVYKTGEIVAMGVTQYAALTPADFDRIAGVRIDAASAESLAASLKRRPSA